MDEGPTMSTTVKLILEIIAYYVGAFVAIWAIFQLL